MFTIKHVWEDGQEFIWQGETPRFVPVEAKRQSQVQLPGQDECSHFAFELADGRCQIIYGNTVYVMNEAGKTVARYWLGDSPKLSAGSVAEAA